MAERTLNTIIGEINTAIKTVSFGDQVTTRGLCYLQEKDEKTSPLENTGNRNGNRISWDDKFPLQTYHRILSPLEKEADLSKGFGKNAFRQRVYNMRLVGIGSRSKLTTNTYEDNHEFANAISDVLPDFITTKEYLEEGDHQVIKQEVYDSEFGGIDQKKYSLEGIAFWIDYTLRVSICLKPDAPSDLSASAIGSTVTLNWS